MSQQFPQIKESVESFIKVHEWMRIMADLIEQMDRSLITKEKQLTALEAEVEPLKTKIGQMETELRVVKKELQEAKTTCATMEGHPDVIKARKVARDARRASLEAELAKLTT